MKVAKSKKVEVIEDAVVNVPVEDPKYSIRRIMLASLETDKEDIRNNIAELQRTLNNTVKLQQTVRHCKKEVLAKYLEEPGFAAQYAEMVNKFKEHDNVDRRESEKRNESSDSKGEQPTNEVGA